MKLKQSRINKTVRNGYLLSLKNTPPKCRNLIEALEDITNVSYEHAKRINIKEL